MATRLKNLGTWFLSLWLFLSIMFWTAAAFTGFFSNAYCGIFQPLCNARNFFPPAVERIVIYIAITPLLGIYIGVGTLLFFLLHNMSFSGKRYRLKDIFSDALFFMAGILWPASVFVLFTHGILSGISALSAIDTTYE